ncbi:MAG: S1 RNA-binding domain-containing protein, partial [Candidatus Gallimonas sp.]
EGDVVHGKVVRIVPFGAFVELEKGIDGLVHVSQITHEWLENPTSALTIGEEVDAKVLAFDPAAHKITLSIKALQPRPEEEPRYDRENKSQKGRKTSRKSAPDEEEEYREWNEGGYGGASIADLLRGEDK